MKRYSHGHHKAVESNGYLEAARAPTGGLMRGLTEAMVGESVSAEALEQGMSVHWLSEGGTREFSSKGELVSVNVEAAHSCQFPGKDSCR